MWYCIVEPHEIQDSQINIIIAIKHSKHISIAIKGTGGLPSRHNLHHNLKPMNIICYRSCHEII